MDFDCDRRIDTEIVEKVRREEKQTPTITAWLERAKLSMNDINQKEKLGL